MPNQLHNIHTPQQETPNSKDSKGPSHYLVPIANGTHCVVSTLPIVPHRHQWPGMRVWGLLACCCLWLLCMENMSTNFRFGMENIYSLNDSSFCEGVWKSSNIHPNYKSRPQKDDFFLLNISDYLDWKHLLIRGFLSCVMFARKHCMSSIFSEVQLGYLKPFFYDMSIPKTKFQFEYPS